jgi:hypothetical protein
MRATPAVAFGFAVLCWMCSAPNMAQDGASGAWQGLETSGQPTADELKTAQDALKDLSPVQLASIHGLRFLMRPAWTQEVFPLQPRDYHLRPWGQSATGKLSDTEALRILALLACGWPDDESLKESVVRFFGGAPGELGEGIPWIGIECMLCHLLVERPQLADAKEVAKRLDLCLRKASEIADWDFKTQGTVGMFQGDLYWRALLPRLAAAHGLSASFRIAKEQLDYTVQELTRYATYQEPGQEQYARFSLNLLLDGAALHMLDAAKKPVADVMKTCDTAVRLALQKIKNREYPLPPAWTQVIAGLPNDLLESAGLGREDADSGFAALADLEVTSTGAFPDNGCLASCLNLYNFNSIYGLSTWNFAGSREKVRIAETALAFVGLNGGLPGAAPGKRVLAGFKVDALQNLLRAATITAAVRYHARTQEMMQQIPKAIEKGCEYLVSLQDEEGRFDVMAGVPSEGTPVSVSCQALCLLTLLHGGYARDSKPVKKGLEVLETTDLSGVQNGTYTDSIVLQFFQRYYLPEQEAAGMLDAADAKTYKAARRKVRSEISKFHMQMIETAAEMISASWNGELVGWGYGATIEATYKPRKPKTKREPRQKEIADMRAGSVYGDNSNSQYGVLGLGCASMLGVEPDVKLVEGELNRWISQYREDPGMRPYPNRLPTRDDLSGPDTIADGTRTELVVQPGGWTYIDAVSAAAANKTVLTQAFGGGATLNMTTAGATSLHVCMLLLRQQGELPEGLEKKAQSRLAGAVAWLSEHLIDGWRVGGFTPTFSTGGRYESYGLYGTERMGLLSGVRVLQGNEDWYRSGADLLLRWQDDNGAWIPGERFGYSMNSWLDTCFAVLFLRCSSPFKPAPAGPITGEKNDKPRGK